MALRDLPWAMMAFSAVVAALAYGLMRLIQVRRLYKDLVRGIPLPDTLLGYILTISEAQATSQLPIRSSQASRRSVPNAPKRRTLPSMCSDYGEEVRLARSLLS